MRMVPFGFPKLACLLPVLFLGVPNAFGQGCGHHDFDSPELRVCNVVGTAGNHEFDEGKDELLRLIYGGNSPKGPFLENPWRGSNYPMISANVYRLSNGKTLFPAYDIKFAKGIPVAFIGAVLKSTPTIVTPTGMSDVFTVACNSFMAAGGDNFLALKDGTERSVGPVDLDALVNFVSNHTQPIDYAIEGRVARLH